MVLSSRGSASPRKAIQRYLAYCMRGAMAIGLAAQATARVDAAVLALRVGRPIDTVAPPGPPFDPGLMRRFARGLSRKLPDLDEAIARFRETDPAPDREEICETLQRLRNDSERLVAIVDRDTFDVSFYQQETAQQEIRRLFRSAMWALRLMQRPAQNNPHGPIVTYFRGIIERAAGDTEDHKVYERFGL